MWAWHRVQRLLGRRAPRRRDRAARARDRASLRGLLDPESSTRLSWCSRTTPSISAGRSSGATRRASLVTVARSRSLRERLDSLRGSLRACSWGRTPKPDAVADAPREDARNKRSSTPQASRQATRPATQRAIREGNWDDSGSSGGGHGGAIDPLTGLLSLGAAAAAAHAARRRRRDERAGQEDE
jgi:hypothetical protein